MRGVPGEAEEAGVAGDRGVESAFSSFYKQEKGAALTRVSGEAHRPGTKTRPVSSCWIRWTLIRIGSIRRDVLSMRERTWR